MLRNLLSFGIENGGLIAHALKKEYQPTPNLRSVEGQHRQARRAGINKMSQSDAVSILLDRNVHKIEGLLMFLGAVTEEREGRYYVSLKNLEVLNRMVENLKQEGISCQFGYRDDILDAGLVGGEKEVIGLEFTSPVTHYECLSFDIRNGIPTWYLDPQFD